MISDARPQGGRARAGGHHKIVDAANRAARIVRNFLTVERRRPPEKAAVSINEIIGKTLDLLTYQARVGNIEIVTDLPPECPSPPPTRSGCSRWS